MKLRLILAKLSSCGLLQLSDPEDVVSREHSFPSKFITEVERDARQVLSQSNLRDSSSLGVLEDWAGPQEEEEEGLADTLAVLQFVCAAVSERCAALASLCVAELCCRQTKVSHAPSSVLSVFSPGQFLVLSVLSPVLSCPVLCA